MKTSLLFFIGMISVSMFSACSKNEPIIQTTLPEEWIIDHEENSEWKPPSPEADEKIKSIFTLQGQALERLTQVEKMRAAVFHPFHGGSGGEPGETPWHLSNFVTEFGVTVQGVFGNLVSDGGFAVKGIWKKQEENSRNKQVPSFYSVQWNTQEPQSHQLEPVIRSIVKAGLIKKEEVFRKNLDQVAGRFQKIVRVLEAAPPMNPNWEVSRFALILSVDASGMVSPAVSVGGELLIRLDWDRPRTPPAFQQKILATQLTEQERNFIRVVHTLGAQMSTAQYELHELEGHGVNLEHFHVGISIGASGNIGLVSLGGTVDGMLYYSHPGEIETIQLQSMRTDFLDANSEIPLIQSKNSDTHTKNEDTFLIQPEAFQKGLKRAMKMGSYFARMGMASQSSEWILDEIETEFEVALSGSIGVVTVESEAHLAFEFHFEGEEK